MKVTSSETKEIDRIAQQLGLDITVLRNEILWSLGEVRIDRVTPTYEQAKGGPKGKTSIIIVFVHAYEI